MSMIAWSDNTEEMELSGTNLTCSCFEFSELDFESESRELLLFARLSMFVPLSTSHSLLASDCALNPMCRNFSVFLSFFKFSAKLLR